MRPWVPTRGLPFPGTLRQGVGQTRELLGAAEDGQRGEHLRKQLRGQPSPSGSHTQLHEELGLSQMTWFCPFLRGGN